MTDKKRKKFALESSILEKVTNVAPDPAPTATKKNEPTFPPQESLNEFKSLYINKFPKELYVRLKYESALTNMKLHEYITYIISEYFKEKDK